MKKLFVFLAMILLANLAGGCGMFGARTYDGSAAYTEAHPDQSQRPPYMDPDSQYNSDNK